MMQGDREFGQFLRRSLHAAAESIAVGEDGLDRIRSRLAEVRRAAAADLDEPPAPRVAGGRLVLVGVSLVGPEHW